MKRDLQKVKVIPQWLIKVCRMFLTAMCVDRGKWSRKLESPLHPYAARVLYVYICSFTLKFLNLNMIYISCVNGVHGYVLLPFNIFVIIAILCISAK